MKSKRGPVSCPYQVKDLGSTETSLFLFCANSKRNRYFR